MWKRLLPTLMLTIVLLGAASASHLPIPTQAQSGATATPSASYAGKIPAPEFPQGLTWFNVDAPLTLSDVRGKVVLLYFCTYSSIKCVNILPEFKRLEAEFPNELVVIGVHSARFSNEGQDDNLRLMVARYEIQHPVINDSAFTIGNTYGVRAWPNTVLIDPTGKLYGYRSGEGIYDALQPTIKGMVAEFDSKGFLKRTPLKTSPEMAKRPATPLLFPAGIVVDEIHNRLIISDTNHHRILVVDSSTYAIQYVIGTGKAGLQDGNFNQAQFNWPHGLALGMNGDVVYVADTGNHAIREIALNVTVPTVETIAGTGQQSREIGSVAMRPALETPLNAPWDVAFDSFSNQLFIAMAGSHQLWALHFRSGTRIETFVGTGREGLTDGGRLDAELAQPSAISAVNGTLYFADAESSAIRQIDILIPPIGDVRTLFGAGLFDFGDKDGGKIEARLQYPQGLTMWPRYGIFVADTNNHKIKLIPAGKETIETILGGERGYRDGVGTDARFWEPSAISYASDKLYIADTNNQVIRVADLRTREVKTIVFPNPEVLAAVPDKAAFETPPADFFGEVVNVKPMVAQPGANAFVLNVILPADYKFNDQAPFRLKVYNTSPLAVVKSIYNNLQIVLPTMPVRIPATLTAGTTTVTMDADIYYCEAKNESLCFPASARFIIPLTIEPGGEPEIIVDYKLVPPVQK